MLMFIRETTMERMIDIMKPEDREMLMEKLMERFSSHDPEERKRIIGNIIRKMGKSTGVPPCPCNEDLITIELLERMERKIHELTETNRHILEELKNRKTGSS